MRAATRRAAARVIGLNCTKKSFPKIKVALFDRRRNPIEKSFPKKQFLNPRPGEARCTIAMPSLLSCIVMCTHHVTLNGDRDAIAIALRPGRVCDFKIKSKKKICFHGGGARWEKK